MEENHERESRCWFRGLVRGRTVVGLLVMGFAGKRKSTRGFWLLFWSDGSWKRGGSHCSSCCLGACFRRLEVFWVVCVDFWMCVGHLEAQVDMSVVRAQSSLFPRAKARRK
ncbi:hypothetical protein KY285_037100 [Solanum tuberosum]|nr:hypothetical protein KY285_036689 [Solanum tuberosum]KAH0640104.1 hypothetical protein KY285_036690 [Solanum tuberosum]KAH0640513.1 hypothetical protein KY285_037099 [Solanum tuberosum]KAH0640514.1 hypothetical protein KY285_037100 [Solanum tuberosum]